MKKIKVDIIMFIKGFILLIISTLSYYIPVLIVGLKGFDINTVPKEFYNYYCWTSSGSLFLIAVYSFYLYYFIDYSKLKVKVLFLWLFLAEMYTFLNHVIKKFIYLQQYNGIEILLTLIIFSICVLFILNRVFYIQPNEVKDLDECKTYLLRFGPKNIFGLINFLVNKSGHFGIYQNGKIYKFNKEDKELISIDMSIEKIRGFFPEEINKIKDIDKYLNQKYSLLTFNCNHLRNMSK